MNIPLAFASKIPSSMTCLLQFGGFFAATLAFGQGPPPRNPPTGKPPEKSPLTKTGDVTYEIGGVQFNSATRELRIPCSVNMTAGVIEYALVSETGKTHESLLKTKVKPFDVQVALLLCHYEPHAGELIKILSQPQPDLLALAHRKMEHQGANLVKLTVEWKENDGLDRSAALGDWIQSKRENKHLDIPHWIFNGADTGDGVFSAELDGSFISVHFDLGGIIGSPAKWTGFDDNWTLDTKAIPPTDSPVTLVISPAPPDAPKGKS